MQYGGPAISPYWGTNRLTLDDCEILAGSTPFLDKRMAKIIADDGAITVDAVSEKFYGAACMGLINSRFIQELTSNYIYDSEYMGALTLGHRYIFVLKYDPLADPPANNCAFFQLSDHLTNPWCEPIQSVEGEPGNYLEQDKFSPLRELVEIADAGVHTFDIVYTEDMGAIMRFSEGDMAIVDGRALTRADSESGAMLCVVSRDLARAYELSVGDTITLKLGSVLFEQFKGLGAVAATRERYGAPVKEATLEIAGIYTDTDGMQRQSKNPNWSYSINTVFVPKSLLPVDEDDLRDHQFTPAEFSFVIDDAWSIPSFLEEAEPLFDGLGLRLIFNDGGWPAITNEFKVAQRLSVINITVFSAAIIIAAGFTEYLFIVRKKKEYAIMRALGAPKKVSALALAVPFMSVTAVSIMIGSGAAWYYSIKTIEQNNTLQALQRYAVDASTPIAVILGCIFGELLLIAMFTLAMIGRVGASPPLALLQSAGGGAKRANK